MDPENIGKVKAIYEDLKLPKLFLQYEEQAYNDIIARIGQMSGGGSNRRLNPEVFYYFLNKIYKRNRQITIIIPIAFELISMRVVIQLLTSMKDVHSFFCNFLEKVIIKYVIHWYFEIRIEMCYYYRKTSDKTTISMY